MELRTQFGPVQLAVLHGQDPGDRHWGCPIREHRGLGPHQQLSLGFEDRLAFTLTATSSFAEAAALAGKWGSPVSPSLLHTLARRLGARAEAVVQRRMQAPPVERRPAAAASELGVLMLDGWLVRQRGPGWGRQKTTEKRVEWHEWKTGVYHRHEQAGVSAAGRGLLTEKVVVGWQGDPLEFGRRLHWVAMQEGLGRSRAQLAVADGAPWIWNLVQDRWAGAGQVLDFYHASQHLWELGRALHGGDEPAAARWAEPRRHQLRRGKEQAVLAEISRLTVPAGEAGKIVQREQRYFAGHAPRMAYHKVHRRGWPIGSGAVESACRQRQCRFKRPGQSWTAQGLRNLAALHEARHNHYWDSLRHSP